MKKINSNSKTTNVALIAGYIAIAIIAALFAFLTMLHEHQNARFFDGGENVIMLSEGWVADDGERIYNISLPSRRDLKINSEVTTLTNYLPDNIEGKTVMMFRTSLQAIEVFVDGEMIYSYGMNEPLFNGNNYGSIWNLIPLEEEYAGKQIKLVISSPYENYRNLFNAFYLGNYEELMSFLIREYGVNFTISLVLMVLGIFMILIYLFNFLFTSISNKQGLWIGIFSFCVGFWDFSESKLTQLLIGNIQLNLQLAFIIVSSMVVPLLLYFDEIYKGRFHRVFASLVVTAEINTFVQIMLQSLGILDFYEMMFASHLIIGVTIVVIFATSVHMIVLGRNKKYIPYIICLFLFCQAGVYEMLAVYLWGYANGMVIGISVVLIILICMGKTIDTMIEEFASGRRAIEESAAKTMFLANMSHEIRTPMNAICAMSEMLSESESLSESDMDKARTINKAALNLLDIINDILDYTKISAEKLEATEIQYSLDRFLTDAYNPINVMAQKKGLDFSVAVSRDVPEHLIGDGGKCRQILINILNNAVKYTNKGGVKLTVDFVKTNDDSGQLIMSVADTGIGISKENIDKIFDAYSSVDLKRERAEESTGLGLAISKGLAQLLGGDIEVVSNEGWGSVFTVTVIQKFEGTTTYYDMLQEYGRKMEFDDSRLVFVPQEIVVDDKARNGRRFTAPEARVMVVDDNSTNLRIMREILGNFDIKPVLIANGTQAIAAVKIKKFELIYMDHMMPGLDGIETIAEIRKMKEEGGDKIKIIALTANAMKGVRDEFIKSGFDGYLSKPVSMDGISETLLNNLPENLIRY